MKDVWEAVHAAKNRSTETVEEPAAPLEAIEARISAIRNETTEFDTAKKIDKTNQSPEEKVKMSQTLSYRKKTILDLN